MYQARNARKHFTGYDERHEMPNMLGPSTNTCVDGIDVAGRAISDSITSALADRPATAFVCLLLWAFLWPVNLL